MCDSTTQSGCNASFTAFEHPNVQFDAEITAEEIKLKVETLSKSSTINSKNSDVLSSMARTEYVSPENYHERNNSLTNSNRFRSAQSSIVSSSSMTTAEAMAYLESPVPSGKSNARFEGLFKESFETVSDKDPITAPILEHSSSFLSTTSESQKKGSKIRELFTRLSLGSLKKQKAQLIPFIPISKDGEGSDNESVLILKKVNSLEATVEFENAGSDDIDKVVIKEFEELTGTNEVRGTRRKITKGEEAYMSQLVACGSKYQSIPETFAGKNKYGIKAYQLKNMVRNPKGAPKAARSHHQVEDDLKLRHELRMQYFYTPLKGNYDIGTSSVLVKSKKFPYFPNSSDNFSPYLITPHRTGYSRYNSPYAIRTPPNIPFPLDIEPTLNEYVSHMKAKFTGFFKRYLSSLSNIFKVEKSAKLLAKEPLDGYASISTESEARYYESSKVKTKIVQKEKRTFDRLLQTQFDQTLNNLTEIYNNQVLYYDYLSKGEGPNREHLLRPQYHYLRSLLEDGCCSKSLKGTIQNDGHISASPFNRGGLPGFIDVKLIHPSMEVYGSDSFTPDYRKPLFLFPVVEAAMRTDPDKTRSLLGYFGPLLQVPAEERWANQGFQAEIIYSSNGKPVNLAKVFEWEPVNNKVGVESYIRLLLCKYKVGGSSHSLRCLEDRYTRDFSDFLRSVALSFIFTFHHVTNLNYLEAEIGSKEVYCRFVKFFLGCPFIDLGHFFLKFCHAMPINLGLNLPEIFKLDGSVNSVLYMTQILEMAIQKSNEQSSRTAANGHSIPSPTLSTSSPKPTPRSNVSASSEGTGAISCSVSVSESESNSKDPRNSFRSKRNLKETRAQLPLSKIEFLRIVCAVAQSRYVHGYILRLCLYMLDQQRFKSRNDTLGKMEAMRWNIFTTGRARLVSAIRNELLRNLEKQ